MGWDATPFLMRGTNMQPILNYIYDLENSDTMDYTGYFNGYDIFHDKDLNGNDPEIFIIAGNRTAGKTFFVKRLLVRLFLTYGVQTMLVTRKMTQMSAVASAFYSDLEDDDTFSPYYFKVDKTDVPYSKGVYVGIKDSNEKPKLCVMVLYINFADNIKEASSLFKNIGIIVKDEFQLETNDYLPNEINNIRSIHKSVSRSFGKSIRYVPLILLGNQLSIINPYYVAFGIHKRLNPNTKKLRGVGWTMRVTLTKQ